jgi:hypothetical protein
MHGDSTVDVNSCCVDTTAASKNAAACTGSTSQD